MIKSNCSISLIASAAAIAMMGSTWAAPTIDGTAGVGDGYGSALSVQNTQTQFGDNNRGDLVDTEAGGSEIDQVFGVVANDGVKDRLYLTIAGNLENNFIKLEIFVDVDGSSGGVNEIIDSQLPAAVDAFCCGGFGTTDGALQRQDGLVFDADFFADYYITLSHGGENQQEPPPALNLEKHWAVTAYYADLTEGTAGRVVAAGMQLAPQGLPSTIKSPLAADYDRDFDVDGSDFLIWQRGFGVGTQNSQGDSDRDGDVDHQDLTHPALGWENRYGDQPGLTDFPFNPTGIEINPAGTEITTALLLAHSPALPGLSQGELIDKNYALGAGGCTASTTDGAAGCIAPELDLALPVDTNDPSNLRNHQDFDNTIDLELALDNSNTIGVEGGAGAIVTGNPGVVLTGVELSIPLDQLLNFLNAIPTGNIRVVAFINGTGHDFVANQFGGVGVLQGNFGFPPNLATEATGNQYVTIVPPGPLSAATVVPEPASLMLLGFAAAAISRRAATSTTARSRRATCSSALPSGWE